MYHKNLTRHITKEYKSVQHSYLYVTKMSHNNFYEDYINKKKSLVKFLSCIYTLRMGKYSHKSIGPLKNLLHMVLVIDCSNTVTD